MDQSLERRYLNRDFFVYNAVIGDVNTGDTVQRNINIQADADFLLQSMTFFAYDDTNSEYGATPDLSLMITDSASGRQIFDSNTPISSIFGDGKFPFILQQPKTFSANSNIIVQVTNFSGNNDYINVTLSFIGTKLYLR